MSQNLTIRRVGGAIQLWDKQPALILAIACPIVKGPGRWKTSVVRAFVVLSVLAAISCRKAEFPEQRYEQATAALRHVFLPQDSIVGIVAIVSRPPPSTSAGRRAPNQSRLSR